MPVPQSFKNHIMSLRAQGVPHSEILNQAVVKYRQSADPDLQAFAENILATRDKPEYAGEPGQKAMLDKALADESIPDETPGLTPPQPGDIRAMTAQNLGQELPSMSVDAGVQMGLMGLGMGGGVLGAKVLGPTIARAAAPALARIPQAIRGARLLPAVREFGRSAGATLGGTAATAIPAAMQSPSLAGELAKTGMTSGTIQTLLDTLASGKVPAGARQALFKALSAMGANLSVESDPTSAQGVFNTLLAGGFGATGGLPSRQLEPNSRIAERTLSLSPQSQEMQTLVPAAQSIFTSGMVREGVDAADIMQTARIPSFVAGDTGFIPDAVENRLTTPEAGDQLAQLRREAAMQQQQLEQQRADFTAQERAALEARQAEEAAVTARTQQGLVGQFAPEPGFTAAPALDAATSQMNQIPTLPAGSTLPLPANAVETPGQAYKGIRSQVAGEMSTTRRLAADSMKQGRDIAKGLDQPHQRVFTPTTMANLSTELNGIVKDFQTVLGRQGESALPYSDADRVGAKIYQRLMQFTPETLTLDELLSLRQEMSSVGKFAGGARQGGDRMQTILGRALGAVEGALRQAPVDAAKQGIDPSEVQTAIDMFNQGLRGYAAMHETGFRAQQATGKATRRTPGGMTELLAPEASGKRMMSDPDIDEKMFKLQESLDNMRKVSGTTPETRKSVLDAFQTARDQLGVQSINKVLKEGRPIPEVLSDIETLAEKMQGAARSHAEAVRDSLRERMAKPDAQIAMELQKNPRALDHILFGDPGDPNLARSAEDFERIARPALDRMSPKDRDNTWRSIISSRLGSVQPDNLGIITADKLANVLNDPIVQKAPKDLQDSLRLLSQIQANPEIMNAKFEAGSIKPDVNEDIWNRLKGATDWPLLRGVLTEQALAGTNYFKDQVLPKVKGWLGDSTWKSLKDNILAEIIASGDPHPDMPGMTEPNPRAIYDKIYNLPDVMKQGVFGDRWKAVLEGLATKEIPLRENIRALRRAPEQKSVGLRRLGAFAQFLAASTGATGAGYALAGKPGAIGASMGAMLLAAQMSIVSPRAAVAKLMGSPSDAARFVHWLGRMNKATGGEMGRAIPRATAVSEGVEEYER